MNSIIGLTRILLKEEFSPRIFEIIRSIDFSSGNHLVQINDILDFSKIESGKLNFESLDFDLKYLVNSTIKSLKSGIIEKGLEIIIHFDEEVPPVITGNPLRLNQILMNLIGNALKFTEKC